MTEPTRPCGTCGMPCTSGEYHPYAACLMFKACHNSETVRANLEAVRATQAQAGAVQLTCEWTHDENDGFWESACGEAWQFNDGGPADNDVRFCQGCGKPLRIKGGQHG